MKIEFNKERFYTIANIVASAIMMGVLIFSLFAISAINNKNFKEFSIFFGFTFLFLALSRVPLIVHFFKDKTNKVGGIKQIVFTPIYFACAITAFCNNDSAAVFAIISGIYLFTVSANRVCLCFERRRITSYVVNIFLAFLSFVLAIGVLAVNSDFLAYASAILSIIMIVSIVDILIFAFSKIKLRGLIKIIKKTYVFEIIYGLVVMIFSFSVYFMILEPGIPTYADALWFSFAVVTTIGFGDFTVTTAIGRVLTVILGFYSIIVVAAITSVIVNYYNEVSKGEDKKDKKEDDKITLLDEIIDNDVNLEPIKKKKK